jgi:hypothetical protein
MIRKLAAVALSVVASAVVLAGPADAANLAWHPRPAAKHPAAATPAQAFADAYTTCGVTGFAKCPFPWLEPPHFTWNKKLWRWVPWPKK